MANKVKEIKVENTEQAVAEIISLYGTDKAMCGEPYNSMYWCTAKETNCGYMLIDTNIPQEIISDLRNEKYSFEKINVWTF